MILLAKFVLQVSVVSTRKQHFLEAASQLIQKQKKQVYDAVCCCVQDEFKSQT